MNAKYPWADWFKKKQFTLQRSDYDCMPHSMVVQIRNYASGNGYSVSIDVDEAGTLKVVVSRKSAA